MKKVKSIFKPEYCENCGTRIAATRETCPVCYKEVKKYLRLGSKPCVRILNTSERIVRGRF